MPKASIRIILIFIAACAYLHHADAQSKAAGGSFSLNGAGISYEHILDGGCFLNADIRAELGNHFIDSDRKPGVSLSLVSNFILKEWKSDNGNPVRFFAGPGITAGMAHDLRKEYGCFFGLKGRIGMECLFSRNIAISLNFSPVIGMHMTLKDDYLVMKYYKYGLIGSAIPEIGIKYLF